MASIAIIEDRPEDSDPLARALAAAQHNVQIFRDEAAAIRALDQQRFDAILLDLDLGIVRDAGIVIMDHIPRKGRSRVVITSARDDFDRLRPMMLRMGAWDYVVKPVEPETIVIYVERILKAELERQGGVPISVGALSWYPNSYNEMIWKGHVLEIAGTACELVKVLAKAEGAPVSKRHLMTHLSTPTQSNLRSHIRNAREAFRSLDENFDALRTVAGKGYAWSE